MSINLLPPQMRQEEEGFPWAAALGFFFACWLCTYLLVLGWGEVHHRQKQIAASGEASARAVEILKEKKQAEKQLASLQVELDSWQIESRRSSALAELLAQLRWRVPQSLWFDQLAIGQDGELQLRGVALSLASLSRFMAELEQFPALGEVTLLSTEQREGHYTFRLQAQVVDMQRGDGHGKN